MLLLSISAAADGQSLSVSVPESAPHEAHTRQVVSAALLCTNTGSETRTVVMETSLPEGWKLLGNGEPFVLAPGTDTHIISVLVPQGTRAGSYAVGCVLQGVDDTAPAPPQARTSLTVNVLPEVEITLEVLEQPAFALAGQYYTASFLLTNKGNADARLGVSFRNASSFPCELSGVDTPEDFPLAAGSNVVLTFTVSSPGTIPHSTKSPVVVTVRQAGAPDGEPLAAATSIVEVVPVSSGTGSLMHTLPIVSETAVSGAFSDTAGAFAQETLKANGSIDEAGEHRVDLLIQKQVGTDADPLMNPNDRYSAGYANSFMDVRIGDNPFSVSPLILMNHNARGAEAGVRVGPVSASSFFYDDVWTPVQTLGLGGAVQLSLPYIRGRDEFIYQASLGVLSPLTDHALLGLYQQLNPLPWLKAQLDAALDLDAAAAPSPGILAAAQGELGPVSFDARYLRAWPGFNGAYEDTQQIGAGAGLRLLDGNLRIQGRFFFSDTNLLLDPAEESAERALLATLGVMGTVAQWQTDAFLQWDTIRRIDLLPASDFSVWENRLSLTLHRPFGNLDLRLALTGGASLDELTGNTTWFQKHKLSGGYPLSDTIQLLGALKLSRQRVGSMTPQNAAGVDATIAFAYPRTQASITLGNDWSFSVTGLAGMTLDLSGRLLHRFPWEHTLLASGDIALTYGPQGWAPAGSLSLSYSVPFSIPVSRKPGAVAVQGTVVRAETKEPMPGVVLRLNGLASVTDSLGRFSFAVPTSGTHYLQFDQRTLAHGLIPAQTMPYQVDSAPGSDTHVTLGVVQGCTVTGTVAAYEHPEALAQGGETPGLIPHGGLGGIVVELSQGTEKMRRVTAADGRFSFTEVRPGQWALRIAAGRLPSYHVVEKESVDVALAAGETQDVELRVIQEQRRIQMVAVADAIVVESPSPPRSKTLTLEGQQTAERRARQVGDTARAAVPAAVKSAAEAARAAERAAAEEAERVSAEARARAAEQAARSAGLSAAAAGAAEGAVESGAEALEAARAADHARALAAAEAAARAAREAAQRSVMKKTAEKAEAGAAATAADVALAWTMAHAGTMKYPSVKPAALSGAGSPVTDSDPPPAAKPPVPVPRPTPTPKPFVPPPSPTPTPRP